MARANRSIVRSGMTATVKVFAARSSHGGCKPSTRPIEGASASEHGAEKPRAPVMNSSRVTCPDIVSMGEQ